MSQAAIAPIRVLSAVVLVLLAGCGEGATQATTPSTVPGPSATRSPLPQPVVAGQLLPPGGSIYFGAYVNTSGLAGGDTPAAVATLEGQLNRRLALHMVYEPFAANFVGRALQDDFNNMRVPVVSWNCGAPDSQIAAGVYDSTIKLKADEARAYGWPVFVRYFWDANLPATLMGRSVCYDPATDTPGNVFSGNQFILAWQHVRSIFAAEGATNVVWLWSVSTAGIDPSRYYPGDSQVDWIGLDAYDTSDVSFASTFSGLYPQLAAYNKPILITETGADAATQSSFFSGAASILQTQFPQVRGFMYYDGVSYISIQNQDWRVTSSAFSAFSAFATDPYMAAHYAP